MKKTFEEIKARVGNVIKAGDYKITVSESGSDVDIHYVNNTFDVIAWLISADGDNYMYDDDRKKHIPNAKLIIKALQEGDDMPILFFEEAGEEKSTGEVTGFNNDPQLVADLVAARENEKSFDIKEHNHIVEKAKLEGAISVYERLTGEGLDLTRA